MNRKYIAQETVAVLERGSYAAPHGSVVNIAPMMKTCVKGTHCYDPQELADLRDRVLAQPPSEKQTVVEVVNGTTLEGCKRLSDSKQYRRIAALNFASAKNPGGGFLGGAQAQEESLARSSGLYKSLLACPEFYAYHRAKTTSLYSDRMIYSPACPVFRTDGGGWLDQPYLVDFITSPAPNAGAILRNEPHNPDQIEPALRERASKVLALAAHHGCDALVLGAWGCGVFRNAPALVAQVFYDLLNPAGPFWGYFPMILYAVFDKSPQMNAYNAFATRFRK